MEKVSFEFYNKHLEKSFGILMKTFYLNLHKSKGLQKCGEKRGFPRFIYFFENASPELIQDNKKFNTTKINGACSFSFSSLWITPFPVKSIAFGFFFLEPLHKFLLQQS